MARHESETRTLGELVHLIMDNNGEHWTTVMMIDLPGHAEAMERSEDDDCEAADAIEAAYIREHESDVYEISWPGHVITPHYNGDASYTLQS